jgi:hypothetical protein
MSWRLFALGLLGVIGYSAWFYFLFNHEQFMNFVAWLAHLVH